MAHIDDSGTPPTADDSAEIERAQHEDALGKKVLDTAGRRGPMVMSTPESIREDNEAIAQAERNAAVTTAARVASHELLSFGELQRALNVKRRAISGAVHAKRLFAIVGPSGENYYPAYYADSTIDLRSLEKISKALGSLPGAVEAPLFNIEVGSTAGDAP